MEEDILKKRAVPIRAWVLGAAAAALVGCGGAGAPSAPTVNLEELQARVQKPRQQPLLLVFWATWCKPCVEEIPELAAIRERHGANLTILGVSLDPFLYTTEKSLELVAEQSRKTPMPYENLLFVGGQDELFEAFDLPGGIPYALLLDAQGQPMHRFNGIVDPDALAASLVGRAP